MQDVQDIVFKVYENVHLEEGIVVLKNFLVNAYMYRGTSVKEMSRMLNLPVPVVSAIKNEFKKNGIVDLSNGIGLTKNGEIYVKDVLGYKNADTDVLKDILENTGIDLSRFEKEIEELGAIYQNRPEVDVEVDQSKCTAETGMKRAVLMLKSGCLIGKKIACIGDDDLTSIAIVLLLKHIAVSDNLSGMADITVFDIDKRILSYIKKVSEEYKIDIECIQHDLCNPIDNQYKNKFDCITTDPPYTLNGLNLFLSRGISVLKKESNLSVFLSFAHKTPQIRFLMQQLFVNEGLILSNIYPKFNVYEGAQILGGVSDLMILTTTAQYTKELISGIFSDEIYTGKFKQTIRTYECKQCSEKYLVGMNQKITTIEQLKSQGCLKCPANKFNLIRKG
ncbi:bis-aminopropyl spermidine synthase family protein [Ruminiclostridium cellulolyticum]|uniref:N(4)-bis(aminopropyl)spermidine synthase C-terminal domain-containing protein n=1 Tax=Ruminiclostridium cellulolyticum (strain ATCC 35319 / DSM 5812 / JCM 6584 / H10) TaxID=394503 RepID=B8HZU6_RUMCH|nr:bis-aminopropyl spermidine synthase family protein [Ruminiclostridium cellulolyticum]ACL75446.1 protein of unknown function DUF43 [Ruminiclostridium cellulolyticum H10]